MGAFIKLAAGGFTTANRALPSQVRVIDPFCCNVIRLPGSAESPVRGAGDAGSGMQKWL